MAEFKLTIADSKTGKCAQRTVAEPSAKSLIGLKIGNSFKGELIDLTGYEFLITGGSDYCGFPMRKGIAGARKNVLIEKGVGFKGGKKGIKRRKTVCGEAITANTVQINVKITKQGKQVLIEEKETGETAKEEGKKESGAVKEGEEKTKESGKEEGKKESGDVKGGMTKTEGSAKSEGKKAEKASKAEEKEE